MHIEKTLQEHFRNSKRDDATINALEDAYTQAKIARFIGLLSPMVCKIVKKSRKR